ncbi:MAG: peptide ABC transporter substrate-binding protein [Alphaproteobacteria bacterium]|nr:peptide ABC transporter substrate-binding protein [Alphaproteobacteria bacterium]
MSVMAAVFAAGVAPVAAQDHDTLTIGTIQFPSTLNPGIDPMAAKSYVLGMAMRPFTVYDAAWKPVCLLCTDLPSIANGLANPVDIAPGKKGIDITYAIRPDASWADGSPVNTSDVMFTYEVGRNPKSGLGSAEMYRRITSIDVKSDKIFTMHFDKLTFDYASIDDFVLLPAHIERPAFADPAQYRVQTRYATDPTNAGLYNGPYRVSAVTRGSQITLVPNTYWNGSPPPFKRIVVKAIENTAALEANLLSGAIDMVAGEMGFSLDEALGFVKRHGDQFQIIYKPGLTFEHIDLNLDQPLLADRHIREALMLGIDRDAISRSLFEGKQPVADSFVSPLDAGYTEDIPHYHSDPDRAGQLLETAGWHVGPDGIRLNDAGQRLSFELMTTAGNHTRELLEQVLQSQWRRIGVDIRIKNQPARVLFGDTMPHRQFDMAMYAYISAPENVPRSIFYSNEIPNAGNGFSGQNDTDYKNPEMDAVIDKLEVELDGDKRKALWAAAQKLYATDLPSLPLFFRTDTYILPKWLSGVKPTGNQYPTTLWITDWKVQQP